MTGFVMILFVLVMIMVLLFSDNDYCHNEFLVALIIAVISFASITVGAICRTNK